MFLRHINALQQKSGVFYAVRAEMLYTGAVGILDKIDDIRSVEPGLAEVVYNANTWPWATLNVTDYYNRNPQ
jgi:hypothetical protein